MLLVRSVIEFGCRLGMRELKHLGWVRGFAVETILGVRNIVGADDRDSVGFGVQALEMRLECGRARFEGGEIEGGM